MIECTCAEDRANIDYSYCTVHVHCDQWCGALDEPTTCAEIEAAYEHWRGHGFLSGCSHGS